METSSSDSEPSSLPRSQVELSIHPTSPLPRSTMEILSETESSPPRSQVELSIPAASSLPRSTMEIRSAAVSSPPRPQVEPSIAASSLRRSTVEIRSDTVSSPPRPQMEIGSTSYIAILSPLPLQTKVERVHNDANDWRQPLYESLLRGDWGAIEQILNSKPEAINGPVGEDGDTPLVVAIRDGLGMPIIEGLVKRMPPETLAACSEFGYSALEWAILNNNLRVAKLLIDRDPQLPNSRNGRTATLPIQLAASRGHRKMTFYLHKVTNAHELTGRNRDGDDVLQCAVASGMYDFALHLLEQLIQQNRLLENPSSPLASLIEDSYAFPSGCRLPMFQSIIYFRYPIRLETIETLEGEGMRLRPPRFTSDDYLMLSRDERPLRFRRYIYLLMERALEKAAWKVLKLVPPLEKIIALKLKHHQALELVESLCKEIKNREVGDVSGIVGHLFISAVQNGIPEIVEEIIVAFPDAINYADEEGSNALHLAVAFRHEKVFHILCQQRIKRLRKRQPTKILNTDAINILQVVAKRPRRMRLDGDSRVVLQMQRELQWYKGVEKLVQPKQRNRKNEHGKLPLEVFDEEHREMLASESEWMRSMANSCIVGGSLIATVVFAAAITVPGGNKSDGVPNFSKEKAFRVFAVSDAFALVTSLTTVVTFLSIFTTRHSVDDFLYGLPNRLIVGLISLFLSLICLMVAFSATVYLVIAEEHHWVIYPTAALSCIPVIFFAKFQLRSLLRMIKSTYGRNIYKYILSNSKKLYDY